MIMINDAPEDHRLGGAPNLLASLQTLVSTLGEDSRSPNTRRAYASAWRGFETWAIASRLSALPASADTLALYVAHLYAKGRRVTTIDHAVVAISQRHADADLPSPRIDRQVRRVLRGIRRSVDREPEAKAPLLPEHVEQISMSLPQDTRGYRDRALLALGFYTGLRRGEIVALDVADLRMSEEFVLVTLQRSKTDPRGTGRHVKALARPGHKDCPVEALRHWMAIAALADGPLFRPIARGGRVLARRLEERSVARLVKAWASSLGLEETRFAGHSLRSGFATSAAKAGMSEISIMRALGHSNLTMTARYVRAATDR